MFVEKLTKEDFIDFIKKYAFKGDDTGTIVYDYNNITKFEKKDGQITITIPNEITFTTTTYSLNGTKTDRKTKINSSTTFKFSDFDFSSNNSTSIENYHNPYWLSFMFDRCGSDYSIAFLELREKERAKMLKDSADEFDKNTKHLTKNFDCGKE